MLQGKWETVVRLLQDENIIAGVEVAVGVSVRSHNTTWPLMLMRTLSLWQTVRFKIAEQKFLEYLEARDTKRALSVLRNELAPLNHNPDRLHQLSRCVMDDSLLIHGKDMHSVMLCFLHYSFMMCGTAEELRERSNWLGSGEASRRQLLESLQSMAPSL